MAFPVTAKYRVTQSDGTLTTSFQKITFPNIVRAISVEHRGLKGQGSIIIKPEDGSDEVKSVTRGGSWDWRKNCGVQVIYVKSSSATVPSEWEISGVR